MSSLLKRALGTLVELDEDEQPKASPTLAPLSGAAHPSSTINAEMVQAITTQCLARRTDFSAFLESASKLEGIIPDETMRLKAALTSVTSGTRTPETIVRAIDVHLADIDTQLNTFKQTSETTRASDVGAVRSQVQEKTAENSRLADQTQRLQAQIMEIAETAKKNTADIAVLTQQADAADAKINEAEAAFKVAADTVRNTLNGRKQIIAALVSK